MLTPEEKCQIRLYVNQLKSLKEKEQYIIYEIYNKGYTYVEISSIFNCKVDETIKFFEEKNIKFCKGLNKLFSRNQFNKRASSNDGLDIYCKEHRRKLVNNSYKKDPCKHSLRMYAYRSQTEIKEKNKIRNQIYDKQHAKFESYGNELKKYIEVRKDPNDNILIQVKCKNCESWMNPTNIQCRLKIGALSGKFSVGAENHFYCSEKCKGECSIFNQKKYTKNEINNRLRDDSVQRQWKKLLEHESIEINGQIQCGVCETIEGPFTAHHFEGINYNPLESADIDAGILLCETCNARAHNQPGCRPVDMRCATPK